MSLVQQHKWRKKCATVISYLEMHNAMKTHLLTADFSTHTHIHTPSHLLKAH